ncbi:DnaD domain-containing protein [Paenibacillus antibioticophila]|uniref:DnaD domain-containing protein n=1 Tax=Paenibacillus antibioticophila TaxID=1274374 RepID=UPI0005CAD763|nr:DnaD domain-containing protein [Paenibacillus antibioticophila]
MMNDAWKAWTKGVSFAMKSGTVNIPYPLLTQYRSLGLGDTEAMLLLQLLAFKQVDQDEFPSMDLLEHRMQLQAGEVSKAVRKLLKEGWISIDQFTDEATGRQSESYNLSGMYERLAESMAAEQENSREWRAVSGETPAAESEHRKLEEQARNLFVVFETEFARPLSPMECETISGWIDQDRYPEELIRLALKEAVFAGKVHFRYIDRILLEWNRNRVRTAEDAKAYIQRFRTGGR